MIPKLGKYIIATGILHTIVGVIGYWKPLWTIIQSGVFNAVEPHFDRTTAFWFLIAGGLMIMLGQIVDWALATTGKLPRSLGLGMIITAIVGIVIMPISGFWLILIEGIIALKLTQPKALVANQA